MSNALLTFCNGLFVTIVLQIVSFGWTFETQKSFFDELNTVKSAAVIANNSITSDMALVVYDENNHNVMKRFYKKDWKYLCKEREIVIEQRWNDLGVAGVVWDAAVVLADFIQNDGSIVHGKSLVELGAGTGLVGMCAALLGAKVTLTDRNDAVKHLRQTVHSNKLDSVTVEELDWTKHNSCEKTYDTIVGADIVYIESLFPDLLRTLICLSGHKSNIFLSCKMRYEKDWKFINMMKTHFEVKEILYNQETDIRIFKANKILS